jgi:ribosomal protein L37E
MVSGRRILPPYYTHRSNGWDLEGMFPDQIGMEHVNAILDSCIVLEERACLPSAAPLLDRLEIELKNLRQSMQQLRPARLKPSVGIRCRFCGLGSYELAGAGPTDQAAVLRSNAMGSSGQIMSVNTMSCDRCGHVEMFNFQQTSSWWKK